MKSLETENGTIYNDLTEESIASALSTLNTTDNTFAIFERNDGSIIQVANNGKKGFYVEMQNFKTKDVIRCDKNFTEIRDVIRLFVEFGRNGRIVVSPKWTKTKTPVKYRAKLFRKLSYIGFAFIGVALYFILTNNFDDHPFAQYIILIGVWLMVPAALIDTVNFIRLLRRGIFDSWAMLGLLILFCAILGTTAMIFK